MAVPIDALLYVLFRTQDFWFVWPVGTSADLGDLLLPRGARGGANGWGSQRVPGAGRVLLGTC